MEEATKDLDDSSVKKRKVDKDCSSILESNVDAILPASLNLDSLGHSESHNHLNQEVFHQIVGEDVVFKDSLLDDLDFPDEDISK